MTGLIPPITDMTLTDDGERLFFGEWPGAGELTLVTAHGLTNQHRNLAGIAAALDGEMPVLAPDLRGRGVSSKPPAGRYGMERHAQDVLQVMDAAGVGRAVVGGHSMGAFVAIATAVLAPDRVAGVVLVDGGVWLEEDGTDEDPTLEMVDIVVQRLEMTFASPQEYLDHWKSYPQFKDGLDEVAESNLLYDVGRSRHGYVPKCSPVAAKEDLEDATLNGGRFADMLTQLACPVLALGAEYGILMAPEPVLGDRHFSVLRSSVSDVDTVTVPGTDHHTIALTWSGAQACADAVRKFVARLDR